MSFILEGFCNVLGCQYDFQASPSLLKEYLFYKLIHLENAPVFRTTHSAPSPLPLYSSSKCLFWFICLYSCQLWCILNPHKERNSKSICCPPATDFLEVQFNGLRGSPRSCLLLVSTTPWAQYLRVYNSDKSCLPSTCLAHSFILQSLRLNINSSEYPYLILSCLISQSPALTQYNLLHYL